MVRIENWSVIFSSSDVYTPPEMREQLLHGEVYGHPSFEDGFPVTTSAVCESSKKTSAGHVVQTQSREYLLGKPSEGYLLWLEQQGIAFDPEQPIRFRA